MDLRYRCALALSVVALAGCGGLKSYPVKGTISVKNGEPLSKGQVVFTSERFSARGAIGPDGECVLGSIKEDDGAPLGTYKVTLIDTSEGPTYDQPNLPVKRFIDPKYETSDGTPLELTVKPGSNEFDIEADPPQ